MTSAPLVSVILPAFNVAPFVSEAVASVAEQDWPTLELLAVDDGSTDGTGELIATALTRFRTETRSARLFSQINAGAGAARNVALAASIGEYVLFLDADDVMTPNAVSALVAALSDRPEAEMIFPLCRHINAEGRDLGIRSQARQTIFGAQDLIADNPIHTGTGVLLRRSAIERAYRFDPSLPACIDLDFWVRATGGQGACIALLDRVLVAYRRRPGQITGNWRNQRAGWQKIARRALSESQLDPSVFRTAEARNTLVWATTAYQAGEYADARRLILRAFRLSPGTMIRSRQGRMRLLASFAALLPERMHRALAARFG